MIAHREKSEIKCPLDVFDAQEENILRLTDAINKAPTITEKGDLANNLMEATEKLLTCPGQAENFNCKLCREFSRLRGNTAALIVSTVRKIGKIRNI